MPALPVRLLSGFTCVFAVVSAAFAEEGTFKFTFNRGQTLSYQVQQNATAEVKSGGETFSTVASVQLVKNWKVVDLAANGVATLELSFKELRFEQTDPTGKKLAFDSKDAAGSNPDLAKQLGIIVGVPVQRIQVAPNGEVPSRETLVEQIPIRQDLPFYVIFPEKISDGSWKRTMEIKLPPPIESDRAYSAVQNYTAKQSTAESLVVEFDTQLSDEAVDPQHRLALVQFVPKGTVSLDPKRGLMVEANLKTDQKIELGGEGDYYHFQSTHTEKLLSP